MPSNFLERLAEGPLLCDGGYVLELERRCVGSGVTGGVPMSVLNYPEGVLELHREFARAGAEVLQAMSWGVRPMERDEELNHRAVELAREAAGPDRFVAGTLSSYTYNGRKFEKLTRKQQVEAQKLFDRYIGSQVEAGVDLMIAETFLSVDEAILAIPFIKQAGVPAVVTVSFWVTDFTREGYTPAGAAKRLVDHGADVVGVNCARPWQTTGHLMRQMRDAVSAPLCSQPTAYELAPGEVRNRSMASAGTLQNRVEPRYLPRLEMANYAAEAKGIGIGLIGSCCGSLPYHVRAMARALDKPVEVPDVDRGHYPT
jgi:betaine-homocysteine S-methyltransferase